MTNKYIDLNNGKTIPVIGLGVWQAGKGRETVQAVLWALEAGYRLIDTAAIYGNEEEVGKAIGQSEIPRQEVFVTTKLWRGHQSYSSVLAAIDDSLDKLSLDYVDLYLVHWPNPESGIRQEIWRAMEEIFNTGKAKAIGVSNYTVEHLEEMKGYQAVAPSVDQVEFHPFWYRKELLEYCQKNEIVLEAYSPLVRGEKLNDQRISKIAQKYSRTNAQILLRWSIQHGCVVIPKSVNKERIKENIDIFNFELEPSDMAALDELNENFSALFS